MSLRVKITAAMVGLILILGLAGAGHARVTFANELRGQLIQRGTVAAGVISAQSEEALITNDTFTLYQLINVSLLNEEDIRYILILDSDGSVRAKTFPGEPPAALLGANRVNPDGSASVKRLPSDEGPIQDVAYPMMGGRLGTVRVGLSENRLLERVDNFTVQLLGITAGVTILALAVSSLLATLLTRPLARLAVAARAVGRGELGQHVVHTGRDEVGRLAAAFNAMVGDLSRSQREIEAYNREILRQSHELATLNSVAATVSESLDVDTVLQGALDQVLPIVRADAGGILLWAKGGGTPAYRLSRGLPPAFMEAAAATWREDGVVGTAVETEEPVVVEDLARDGPALRAVAAEAGLHPLICVPLRSRERVVGVMNVGRYGGEPFDERDVGLLMAIGRQVGVAAENAYLLEEIKDKERAQSDLLKKVISAQEDERQRIARELHDEMAQGLTALVMGLGRLEQAAPALPPAMLDLVENVKWFASHALADTRRLIADLRPPLLDDMGLVPAVRTLAENRLEPHGVSFSVSAEGFQERLPAHVETTIFRILQEAISNCARHARASTVHIHLAVDAGRVRAMVRDDGVGLQPAGAASANGKRGLGILGMKERAALLGGSLDVQSGAGTTVLLDVPLAGATEGFDECEDPHPDR